MKTKNLLNKRLPTVLGLLLLIAGLGVGIFLVGTGTFGFLPKASPETTPKRLLVTNLTDTGFSISFITDASTPGFLKLGTSANKLDQSIQDDRDQLTGSTGNFTTHHVTVHNLQPNTTYYFNVGTGTNTIYNDNGKPYTVTTGASLGSAPTAITVYGSVLTPASTPAEGSVVYIAIDGAQPQSTLVKSSGSWAIPLSTARTVDLKSYFQVVSTTSISLFVQGKDGTQTSTATVTVADAQPVQTITLGQNGEQQAEATPTPTPVPTPEATPDLSPTPTTELSEVTFLNPAKELDVLNTTQPELMGTGPVGQSITIEVQSPQTYTDTITVGPDGEWSFTPPADLDPGEHTVTITYTDASGTTQKVSRTFIVAAPGTSDLPAITATPSGSVAPRVSYPATDSGIPVTGAVENTFIILAFGSLLIGSGLYAWRKLNI